MLEDIFSALGPALSNFAQTYSFQEDDRKRRAERDRERSDRLNREGVDQMYRDQAIHENARRYGEQQRQAQAGVVAEQMSPNQEIDDLTYSFLQGTPHEARVRSQTTIPTNAVAGDMAMMPGGSELGAVNVPAAPGMPSRTWRPTWAESRQVEKDAALNDVLNDPAMARYGGRIRAGLGTSELPHERATREASGDQADTARSLAVEAARAKSVLDEVRLRASLDPSKDPAKKPLWDRHGEEYRTYVAQHGAKQKQRQDEAGRLQKDPLAGGRSSEVHYEEPLSFDQWLEQRKGIKPYGGGQIPITPRSSHTNTTVTDQARVATPGPGGPASGGLQVGQRVTAKGKSYTVGKVYADGSWDPAPDMALGH